MKSSNKEIQTKTQKAWIDYSDKSQPLYKQNHLSSKSTEEIEMEEILKKVMIHLKWANPYAVSQFTADEMQYAVKYCLGAFGLKICKTVCETDIAKLSLFGKTKSPQFQTFINACIEYKNCHADELRTKSMISDKNKIIKTNASPMSLKELLRPFRNEEEGAK